MGFDAKNGLMMEEINQMGVIVNNIVDFYAMRVINSVKYERDQGKTGRPDKACAAKEAVFDEDGGVLYWMV